MRTSGTCKTYQTLSIARHGRGETGRDGIRGDAGGQAPIVGTGGSTVRTPMAARSPQGVRAPLVGARRG